MSPQVFDGVLQKVSSVEEVSEAVVATSAQEPPETSGGVAMVKHDIATSDITARSPADSAGGLEVGRDGCLERRLSDPCLSRHASEAPLSVLRGVAAGFLPGASDGGVGSCVTRNAVSGFASPAVRAWFGYLPCAYAEGIDRKLAQAFAALFGRGGRQGQASSAPFSTGVLRGVADRAWVRWHAATRSLGLYVQAGIGPECMAKLGGGA
jgi:hypothetical protein